MIPFCSKELHNSNCGFDHDPVDAIVRSQWQEKSKSYIFLTYRWIVGVFVTFVVIYTMVTVPMKFPLYFIYLTHWGVMINMIVGVMGVTLVTLWHFNKDFEDRILDTKEMPMAFKVYWALHNTALTVSFVVTILFWTLLYPNIKMEVDAANVLSHAMNSVIMFIDILVVAYPMRLYHVIQPIAFAVSYVIFSYIYYLCGGVDFQGNHFIYNVLDWSEPKIAIVTVLLALVLAMIVHVMLFWVTKLRMFIHKRCFKSKMTYRICHPANI